MNVTKKSGKEVLFELSKIQVAIERANKETKELSKEDITNVVNKVLAKVTKIKRAIASSEIQKMVEDSLMQSKFYETARSYIEYRYQKELNKKQNTTDTQILSTINLENEEVKQENSNKNPIIVSTQRDYIAGIVSKDLTRRYLLPKEISEAHDQGIIHFHDSDYYIQKISNCSLINLEDILQNGTVVNGIKIEKPHKILTASTIATQVITAVASQEYGGCTITLTHLAPFVRDSYNAYLEEAKSYFKTEDERRKYAHTRMLKEVKDAVQTFNYQINSMSTTNGQAPFVSVFMYLGETKEYRYELSVLIKEFLRQRIKGMKNPQGVWITPAFPKLLYVLEEDNINKDGKYYYLTELAAKCTAKRMVPDYISEKIMKELKQDKNEQGHCFPCMGCRSFLSVWNDDPDKYYGRFNKGVVTLNLVDVACSSKKNIDKFWQIFDERLELCHKALVLRYERLKGTPSDVAPMMWQHGAMARLKPGETIDRLLVGGYSTLSLGYAGLWEMVYYMTGKKLTDPEGEQFGLQIMKYMKDKCEEWNNEIDLGFSLYGTPIESTTYKFAKCLQNRFGIIEGVTDKNYITNSYHVHVTEDIDAFSKIKLESNFQKLSTGGAISYVECPNLTDNVEAVLSILNCIYDNIMYAELNTKSDYCQVCGYDKEIPITEDCNHKLLFECPKCGNRDRSKLNIARRVCGYISTNEFNQGRTQEIKERKLHI